MLAFGDSFTWGVIMYAEESFSIVRDMFVQQGETVAGDQHEQPITGRVPEAAMLREIGDTILLIENRLQENSPKVANFVARYLEQLAHFERGSKRLKYPQVKLTAVNNFKVKWHHLQSSAGNDGQIMITVAIVAALIVELGVVVDAIDTPPPIISAHMGAYCAWKETNLPASSNAAASLLETLDAKVANATTVIESAEKAQKSFASLRETVEEIYSTVETSKANIAAFSAAVREELRIDSNRKLWAKRANEGAKAFQISAFVLAIMLGFPPLLLLTHISEASELLRKISEAASTGLNPNDGAHLTAITISKLVIVTTPLVLYFWAIRLVVRFNGRSMLMMDDARQRETMMDTYVHLIETSNASANERALVLNALFRPSLSTAQENVEPPNFIELIGKGKD